MPVGVWSVLLDTATDAFHVRPPLVEVNARTDASFAEYGTTTVPLGWTSGRPPSPDGRPDGICSADQVCPPSCEVTITIRLLLLVRSTST